MYDEWALQLPSFFEQMRGKIYKLVQIIGPIRGRYIFRLLRYRPDAVPPGYYPEDVVTP